MDQSVNAPHSASNAIIEWVWYEGSDALSQGEGVCYNTDYGTAANFDGRRANRVERPSSSNNKAFAGVAARDYRAVTNGQFIEIYVPGSKGVYVALGVDTVLDTGILNFQVGYRYLQNREELKCWSVKQITANAKVKVQSAKKFLLTTKGL